jgi:hypothetical protein
MPAAKRSRVEPTDDWGRLQLRFQWPEQTGYELIRPVVLFGFTPAEWAQQTGNSCELLGAPLPGGAGERREWRATARTGRALRLP